MKKKLLKSALAVALKALKRAERKNAQLKFGKGILSDDLEQLRNLAETTGSEHRHLEARHTRLLQERDRLLNEAFSTGRLYEALEKERDALRSDVERLEQQLSDVYSLHNTHLLEAVRTEMNRQNLIGHLQAICWSYDIPDLRLEEILESYKAHLKGGGAEHVVNIKPSIGEEGYKEPVVHNDGVDPEVAAEAGFQNAIADFASGDVETPGGAQPSSVDGDEAAHIVDWTPTPAGDATLDADVANCTAGVNSATQEQIDAVNDVEARYSAIDNAHGNVDLDRVVSAGAMPLHAKIAPYGTVKGDGWQSGDAQTSAEDVVPGIERIRENNDAIDEKLP